MNTRELFAQQADAVAAPVKLYRDRDLLLWFDAIWVATVLTAMLLVQLWGSLSALIIVASLPVFVFFRRDRLGNMAAAATVLCILPLWALFSALWSHYPGETLYYGAEYLITILVGVIIGTALNRNQVIFGLFAAFAVHAIASLLLGEYVDVGRAGSTEVEQAFAGIMASKNIAADASGVGILVSAAMIVLSLRERLVLPFLAGIAVIGIDVWMVLKAESTGALVSAIIATIVMVVMQVIRLVPVQARTLLMIVGIAVMGAALVFQNYWLPPLLEAVLESSGKDASLTGRTYIWERAWTVIDAHPALGVGYNAFWVPFNPEAEILWDFAGITGKRGFNFHNTIMELLVHFGYIGLLIFGSIFGVLSVVLIGRVTRMPTEFGIFAVSYLCFLGVRAPYESFGIAPFLYSTALIAAGLSWGLRRNA